MRTEADLLAIERTALDQVRKGISHVLSSLGFRLTLFGSRARGDAADDADLDLLVEVDCEDLSPRERDALRRIANEVSAESGLVLCLLVTDGRTRRERGDFSVFENIREEGIPL